MTGVAAVCSQCRRPLDEHDRNLRFRLPDPVLDSPDGESNPAIWLSEPDPDRAVMMEVPDIGAFVRCLLPVRLDGGYTVTFGVWLEIDGSELREIHRVWWEPEYADIVLNGSLANALPLWGLRSAPATARVIDLDATPYIVSSTDADLRSVLEREWPHEEVLGSLA